MLTLLIAAQPAMADYVAPPPGEMLKQASGVFDATVTGFDADGRAALEVHQTLSGTAPKTLFGATYTCFGGMSVQAYGVTKGQRYVFVVQEDRLFEEQTFFAVRGDLEVEFWTNDTGYERSWQPMQVVRDRVGTPAK